MAGDRGIAGFARAQIRRLIALGAVVTFLIAEAGTSHAGLDNELSLVDGHGRTLSVQQWDTFLNGVAPLDHNRLTREWFHSGKATYLCDGPGCETFTGTVVLGYEIGFPWSLGVGIRFSYTTPNVLLDKVNPRTPVGAGGGGIITPNLLPGVSISANLGNGPGVQEVSTVSVNVSGPRRSVAVSNAHGTLTGAAGGVLLRPFARLISKAGDSVTTFGEPWNMN
jgi:MspA